MEHFKKALPSYGGPSVWWHWVRYGTPNQRSWPGPIAKSIKQDCLAYLRSLRCLCCLQAARSRLHMGRHGELAQCGHAGMPALTCLLAPQVLLCCCCTVHAAAHTRK